MTKGEIRGEHPFSPLKGEGRAEVGASTLQRGQVRPVCPPDFRSCGTTPSLHRLEGACKAHTPERSRLSHCVVMLPAESGTLLLSVRPQ